MAFIKDVAQDVATSTYVHQKLAVSTNKQNMCFMVKRKSVVQPAITFMNPAMKPATA